MRVFRLISLTLASAILILMQSSCAVAWSPAVISIAASNSTSVALLDDGTVWQWGYVGDGVSYATPQKAGITVVRQIAAGYGHVLALKGDGSVWAWGSNAEGQLGNRSASPGTPVLVLMPTQILPSPTPTPIIVTASPAVTESGPDYMLPGSVGLWAVFAIVVVCGRRAGRRALAV